MGHGWFKPIPVLGETIVTKTERETLVQICRMRTRVLIHPPLGLCYGGRAVRVRGILACRLGDATSLEYSVTLN